MRTNLCVISQIIQQYLEERKVHTTPRRRTSGRDLGAFQQSDSLLGLRDREDKEGPLSKRR